MEVQRRAPARMIKIDWLELMDTWTVFGFYSAILVEGGPDVSSKVVGRKLCWSWPRYDKYSPNIFRVYNRATAIKNYGAPKEINK